MSRKGEEDVKKKILCADFKEKQARVLEKSAKFLMKQRDKVIQRVHNAENPPQESHRERCSVHRETSATRKDWFLQTKVPHVFTSA